MALCFFVDDDDFKTIHAYKRFKTAPSISKVVISGQENDMFPCTTTRGLELHIPLELCERAQNVNMFRERLLSGEYLRCYHCYAVIHRDSKHRESWRCQRSGHHECPQCKCWKRGLDL